MLSIVDGVFWGALLIALGVWLMVRRALPVHIPVGRVIVAVLLVYLGVRMLAGGTVGSDRNTVVFSQAAIAYSPDRSREYNLIFSAGSVDLSSASATDRTLHAEVNVVFGSGTLRINPSAPVRVRVSSAIASVETPRGRAPLLGDTEYTTASWRDGAPGLDVHATAAFGRLVVLP